METHPVVVEAEWYQAWEQLFTMCMEDVDLQRVLTDVQTPLEQSFHELWTAIRDLTAIQDLSEQARSGTKVPGNETPIESARKALVACVHFRDAVIARDTEEGYTSSEPTKVATEATSLFQSLRTHYHSLLRRPARPAPRRVLGLIDKLYELSGFIQTLRDILPGLIDELGPIVGSDNLVSRARRCRGRLEAASSFHEAWTSQEPDEGTDAEIELTQGQRNHLRGLRISFIEARMLGRDCYRHLRKMSSNTAHPVAVADVIEVSRNARTAVEQMMKDFDIDTADQRQDALDPGERSDSSSVESDMRRDAAKGVTSPKSVESDMRHDAAKGITSPKSVEIIDDVTRYDIAKGIIERTSAQFFKSHDKYEAEIGFTFIELGVDHTPMVMFGDPQTTLDKITSRGVIIQPGKAGTVKILPPPRPPSRKRRLVRFLLCMQMPAKQPALPDKPYKLIDEHEFSYNEQVALWDEFVRVRRRETIGAGPIGS